MDKQTQKTMFSSKTGNWATPQEFFDKLNWRFGPFNLDPCASTHNTKCVCGRGPHGARAGENLAGWSSAENHTLTFSSVHRADLRRHVADVGQPRDKSPLAQRERWRPSRTPSFSDASAVRVTSSSERGRGSSES